MVTNKDKKFARVTILLQQTSTISGFQRIWKKVKVIKSILLLLLWACHQLRRTWKQDLLFLGKVSSRLQCHKLLESWTYTSSNICRYHQFQSLSFIDYMKGNTLNAHDFILIGSVCLKWLLRSQVVFRVGNISITHAEHAKIFLQSLFSWSHVCRTAMDAAFPNCGACNS